MSDSINSTGSGVVHGHIHNYDNLTYIHGHVHHKTYINNNTSDHNFQHEQQNKHINNSNSNDDSSALLTHDTDQNNLQLHEHCKPFEFFDFHNNNNRGSNSSNSYNIYDNHDHISDYRNNTPFNSVSLDLPFTYHQTNDTIRIKRKFEELDDNILSNTAIKKHQNKHTNKSNNVRNDNNNHNNDTVNDIEYDCNPKIFEICCDIDHHNSSPSGTIKNNEDNKNILYDTNGTSFNKDSIMIHALKNGSSSTNSHLINNNNTSHNTVNIFDLQNKIKYLSDLNCTFDCDFDCGNMNKITNHNHDNADTNNNNNNNTDSLSSDSFTINSFDKYCQLCSINEPHKQHKYGSKPMQSHVAITPASNNNNSNSSSNGSIATTTKNNDMSILQDLCNISSLYEVPFAQHMSHYHNHNHTHDQERIFNQQPQPEQLQIQKETKDIDNKVTEYDNLSSNHSSASNLLDPVINSSLLNKTPNTKSKNNHNHHHHKIELHTHAPMINNYTVLDNKTRQTILNNTINFHIDSKTDPIKEKEKAEYSLNMDVVFNKLNTIDFNWNYKRDRDKDMKCLWDDCDNEYKFDNLIDLQKHMFVDHIPNDNDYSCHWQDCLFHGNDVCSLVNHINDQHGINFGIKVKEPTHLPVNMIKEEKKEGRVISNDANTTNRYVCQWDNCQIKFDTKKELNEHLEKDHIPRRKPQYRCNWNQCNKNFNQRQKLLRHIKVHTGYKPYKCDVCDKTFANQETLIQHKRIHSGEKPYKCNICGKCFGGSSSLKIHIRTHTGEKPLKCHVCGKRFNESSNLNKHLRTHSKEFCCPNCGKRFSTLKYLKQHELSGNCTKTKVLNI